GKNVAELHRRGYRFPPLFRVRELDHQRHLQSLAIDEDAVLRLAMIPQSFAVIRKKENQRVAVDSFRFQERDEVADDGVRTCDLAVVPGLITAAIRLRR